MGDKSAIEWTDATWNPVTGCSKVSPGCANCYAETMTARYAGNPGWIEEHRPWTPANAEHNVRLRPERLPLPLRWAKPRMVFVNSMSDLFHELVPDEYVAACFAVMALAPRHTFQVLTKRPERMAELVGRPPADYGPVRGLPAFQHAVLYEAQRLANRHAPGRGMDVSIEWPLPNVWLGTSIELDRWTVRADDVRRAPAAVRFLSCEPLLGPLPSLSLEAIDWVIVGGESAGPAERALVEPAQQSIHLYPDARFHRGSRQVPKAEALGWVRDLRDRCLAAGVAFLFKQWGGPTPKSGGRELDGRTWDEYPVAVPTRAAV